MVSDEDPTGEVKTFKQMYYCNVLNTVLPVIMSLPQIGMIHPLVLVPFMYYQALTFKALNQFRTEKASV